MRQLRPSHSHLFFFAFLVTTAFHCSPSRKVSVAEDGRKQDTRSIEKKMEGVAWTSFRGNSSHTGHSAMVGPRVPILKWAFRTQGRIYADVAVTQEGTVYVASHDHYLYAVNPDGRELWSYDAGGKIWSSPALDKDGIIYFGSDEDRLIALFPNGKEKWTFSTTRDSAKGDKPEASRWDVDTSPIIQDDGTIVFGCHYYLYGVRPTGLLKWHFQAGEGRTKIFSSPALGSKGNIYFGAQNNSFFALDPGAKLLWKIHTEGDNDSTPAVGVDGTIYLGSDDGKLRAVHTGGNLKWERDLGAPIRAPLAIGPLGTVYASTCDSRPFLAAVDGKTGKEKWRFHITSGEGAFYGIQSGALVDGEGYIYFGGRDHFVYCLSPNGELVWKYELGDQVDSGPVLGPDGTLYVGCDDKRLYAFSPN